jgi:RNA-splicing ligase RtcB
MTTYAAIERSPLLREIPVSARAGMRVPARIYADAELWEHITQDRSLEQLLNVATLPGVVEAVYAMPEVLEAVVHDLSRTIPSGAGRLRRSRSMPRRSTACWPRAPSGWSGRGSRPVRCASNAELAEEAPAAYKDVERVVNVIHRAGLARKVARLRPIGVVKG